MKSTSLCRRKIIKINLGQFSEFRVFKVISNFEREVAKYTTNIQEIDTMEGFIRQTLKV